MRNKLFKKLPDEQRRDSRIKVRLNEKEAAAIRHAAEIRMLTVSEYLRRTALARRADVQYEMEIVSRLSQATMAIRELHADMNLRNRELEAEDFRPVIIAFIESIKLINDLR